MVVRSGQSLLLWPGCNYGYRKLYIPWNKAISIFIEEIKSVNIILWWLFFLKVRSYQRFKFWKFLESSVVDKALISLLVFISCEDPVDAKNWLLKTSAMDVYIAFILIREWLKLEIEHTIKFYRSWFIDVRFGDHIVQVLFRCRNPLNLWILTNNTFVGYQGTYKY